MCITYDRKPRAIKYVVEGEVKIGRADHHDYVLPRSIVSILAIIGTFLFVAGAIILMVGSYTSPGVLLPWGGVVCGIGFLFCFIAILLCMHAHCIIPVDGYKIPTQLAKNEVVLVRRVDSRENERFANKRVFAAGDSAGDTGTMSSTMGRSGYISSGHPSGHTETVSHQQTQSQSQSAAYQSSGGYATIGSTTATGSEVGAGGGRAYGTMDSSQGNTQIVVQPPANYATTTAPSSTARSVSHESTSKSVTVVDGGNISVVSRSDEMAVPPPAGAKRAVYVQVQTQSPPSGQQAQRMQSHAEKVEYAQIQAKVQPAQSSAHQQDVMVATNTQQQHSAPAGHVQSHQRSAGMSSGGQVQSHQSSAGMSSGGQVGQVQSHQSSAGMSSGGQVGQVQSHQSSAGMSSGGQVQSHQSSAGMSSGGQQQYSYSSSVREESVSGAQPPSSAPLASVVTVGGGHHYAASAGQPAAGQTVYYSETTKQYTTTDGGLDDTSATSAGLLVPSHFHGEATPDMRYMRRDMSNMSNVSNMSAYSRPDSFGVERDDDFQYYPVGGEDGQQQSNQSQQSYQYSYSVEQPQVQTQSQSSTVAVNQSHSGVYKGDRKASLYENTQLH